LVTLAQTAEQGFSISVRDEGIGLPLSFDAAKSKGLGMRLVTAFAQQLNGALDIRSTSPGTEFVVRVPV